VFDNQRRPWVVVDNGSPDEIGEVIQRCPTGALHFRRRDGGPQEPVPEQAIVQERPNGPLFMRGNVAIFSADRTPIREDTRAALCRCGASANKPFCDGSHRKVGFRTTR
jgi:CDGSH-type Zn-finger protein